MNRITDLPELRAIVAVTMSDPDANHGAGDFGTIIFINVRKVPDEVRDAGPAKVQAFYRGFMTASLGWAISQASLSYPGHAYVSHAIIDDNWSCITQSAE